MEQRLTFISLGVHTVERSREFYLTGLGWTAHQEVPGQVIFLQLNHGLILSLWSREAMAAELGVEPSDGVPPITLSHNVGSVAEVDAVLAQAVAAGAVVDHPAAQQPWGGYSGYFADPDGFRWEVAFNPTWAVDDAGNVTV
ncbi:VOC family protein [Arthrobacter glacialis]|uniref:Glyoxalase n=1 Tax=Arthrobacter glacialis TaxID=1664 RepID=A0A2S3ZWT1_ARTGL|nr:VOC family protein [Arthrobacter glacialis]POH58818.1 glyoxalase [Arthrobacter glacialis]POH73660.1 glyoxalase [Arthrobacter glacialis]